MMSTHNKKSIYASNALDTCISYHISVIVTELVMLVYDVRLSSTFAMMFLVPARTKLSCDNLLTFHCINFSHLVIKNLEISLEATV